jgi:hypothetical protein
LTYTTYYDKIFIMKSLFRTFHNLRKISNVVDAEERYVALQLIKSLPNHDYAVMNNVLLPNKGRIGTSQIDHIIVSVYGVFCIETKSHKGWIFGSKIRKIFTQVLYRSKYRIVPNPVEQNNTHIRTLIDLLKPLLKEPIINIVVFPSAEKFVIDGYENVGSMNDVINAIASHTDKTYRYAEAREMIETICKYDFKHPVAHAQHAERVRAVHAHVA